MRKETCARCKVQDALRWNAVLYRRSNVLRSIVMFETTLRCSYRTYFEYNIDATLKAEQSSIRE
jgi:hypothetical protein